MAWHLGHGPFLRRLEYGDRTSHEAANHFRDAALVAGALIAGIASSAYGYGPGYGYYGGYYPAYYGGYYPAYYGGYYPGYYGGYVCRRPYYGYRRVYAPRYAYYGARRYDGGWRRW
jgi:hypothetical protein